MKKEKKEETPEKETTPGFNVTVNEDITESWPAGWDYNLTNAKTKTEKAAALEIVTQALQAETRELYPGSEIKTPELWEHTLKHSRDLKGKRTGVFFVETVQPGEIAITGGKTVRDAETRTVNPNRGRLVVITGATDLILMPTQATKRNVLVFNF